MTADQTFAPRFLRFDRLDSTNTEALRQAQQGAAEGLCVLAREQSAGRGRQEHTWFSPRDAGLYLSLVLRPRIPLDQWPILTLMAAVAVHEALDEVFGLSTDIKWPNDILASERKLAGILAETVESAAGRAVVLGIGVNLLHGAVPDSLREFATSVAAETGKADPSAGEFAQVLVPKLAEWYAKLQRPDGAARVAAAWSERSSYSSGKAVSVITGGESFTGITQGISSQGALHVITDDGKTRLIYSAEVTGIRPARPNDET